MFGLLKPKAAVVPNVVARNVADKPIIKLFTVPNIHLLVHTVVIISSSLHIPNICLYHRREKASGFNCNISGVKPKKGEALKAIENSAHRLKGNFTTGSQEHFALEGQVAFVVPQEDNDFKVFSKTQHPSETQQIIAKMLNQKSNTITVETRRLGGSFGGTETQSFVFAAICTLLAKKTKRAVKLRIDRDDDIIITGKRHDFYSEYEVGFDELGVIKGLRLKLASRCGMSPDLSGAINDRALLHIDNAYFLENILVENYLCKTNTASNTAFRGFGGNQGMMAIENIIDHIATSLKKDSAEIRRRNFYQKKKKNITHYNMKIEDNVIQEIFDQLIKSSNYKSRQLNIKKFNSVNK